MLSADFKFSSEQNISWEENTKYRIKIRMEIEVYLKDQAETSEYRVRLQVLCLFFENMPCIRDVPSSNHKAPWFFWQWAGKKEETKKIQEEKKRSKKKFFFQIDADLIAYEKRVFFKNSWNVLRWYMFNDSKKLATKKTQQQLALLHIKWQERRSSRRRRRGRREGGVYKQTKKICTTTCFYLAVAAPAGLPGKAITWPLTLGGRHRLFFFLLFFQKNVLILKHTNYSHYIILPN